MKTKWYRERVQIFYYNNFCKKLLYQQQLKIFTVMKTKWYTEKIKGKGVCLYTVRLSL